MAAGLLGGLFGGGKKSSAAAPASSAAPSGPIIKPLGANDPLRKGKSSSGVPLQDRLATILSDKLGN